jgi:hypothetical protein
MCGTVSDQSAKIRRTLEMTADRAWMRWAALATLGLVCLGFLLLTDSPGARVADCSPVFMATGSDESAYLSDWSSVRAHCNSWRIQRLAWSVPITLLTVLFGGLTLMTYNRAQSA